MSHEPRFSDKNKIDFLKENIKFAKKFLTREYREIKKDIYFKTFIRVIRYRFSRKAFTYCFSISKT